MRGFVLLLTFIALLNIAVSAELQGKFVIFDTNIEAWTEGQYFNAKIEIWPVKDSMYVINTLNGSVVGGKIYISAVSNVKRSENNWEVVTADISGVITGALSRGDKLEVKAGQNAIVFKWEQASLSQFKDKKDKLILVEQSKGKLSILQKLLFFLSELSKVIWLVFLFVIALVLVLVPPRIIRFFRHKKLEKERKRLFKEWSDRIKLASEREELEELYRKRREWMRVMNFTDTDCREFFKELNKFQYKPKWTEHEHDRVKSALKNVIRDIDGV